MKKILIKSIKVYKLISVFRPWGLPMLFLPDCKFHPSCSDYAINAINKYGTLIGSVKSIWRVLRCNPVSSGGIDNP